VSITILKALPDRARHRYQETGAVVLGGDYQGLGIIRSLGHQKIPVCVIDDEHSIGRFSRYATQAVRVDDLRHEERIVDTVLEVGRRLNLRGWVLYPTRDEMVAAFARYQHLLTGFFRVPTPGWDSIQWVWDKRNTYRLANQLAIPTPSTWYPKNLEELDSIPVSFPAIIKPAIKERFFYATKVKAWRVNNRAELRKLFERAMAQIKAEEIMVQDLIPGGGSQQFAYCAFFKQGSGIATMMVRRSRQHPAEFGRASTFVETVDLPLLKELSERFLRAIKYYGLVEVEFKLDPRDGQYKLLDVNARTWGYHSLGLAAGVDFPYLLFADQNGRGVEPCRASTGVRWIRLLTDLPTGLIGIFRRHDRFTDYLASVVSFDVEAVFSLQDPWPGIMELTMIPYLYAKRGY